MNGLVEKFYVLDKDNLANTLQKKLQELAALSNKWTPEVLSFLLLLSDRPAEKSDVESLKPRAPSPQEVQLTWAEILADDPMSDDDLWRDIPFSPDSTDDEEDEFSSVEVERTEEHRTNVDVDAIIPSKLMHLSPDEDVLDSLQRVQFWGPSLEADGPEAAGKRHTKTIPELYAIREAILMLQGLPTSLFLSNSTGRSLTFTDTYSLTGVSATLLAAIMGNIAEIGSKLAKLRNWSQGTQSSPLLQSFQHAVLKRLRSFNKELAGFECQFALPDRASGH